MRHAWRTYWVLLLISLGAGSLIFVLSRGRALAVVVIVIAVLLVGTQIMAALRDNRAPEARSVRNVTPHEATLRQGPASTIAPRGTESPVVVIDPTTRGDETLESKLATLDRLRASGTLTEAEYEAKRAQLIADF
jgi:hypothetical protein